MQDELTGEAQGEKFGRYRLVKVLSRGSLGVVYRAYDPMLRRDVAIKVLSQARLADDEEISRFMREARAVARLSHPNVVPVHEVGSHQDTPYFTMDFIHGKSISQLVQGEGPLSPRRAVEICREVAEALSAAHSRGIIHRDIKPSNVMLTTDGRVLVMDFGLAKVLDEDTLKTRTGTAIGTPAYMPPEQARGETDRIGPASDVYSLGAVLYECVTGRAPFEGQGVVDIVLQVMDYPPPPPRALNPRVPRDLESVILKCLDKEIRYRYEGMADLERDLDHFLNGEAVEARPPSMWRRFRAFMYRQRALFAGALVGAVLVVGLLLVLTLVLRKALPEGGRTLAFVGGFDSAQPALPELFSSRAPLVDFRDGAFHADVENKELVTEELFYGNYRAELTFRAGKKGAPVGLRIRGQDKATIIVKHDGRHLLLIGQNRLEDFSQQVPFKDMTALAAVDAPTLVEGGLYRFTLERRNLDMEIGLGEVGRDETGGEIVESLAEIRYRGLQLTNWRLKNAWLGVMGVGSGINVGELRVWLEVPGEGSPAADDRFYRGDYNGAQGAYKGLLEKSDLPQSLRAHCLLHLAYYHEIKAEYEDALKRLEVLFRMPQPLDPAILADARIRRLVLSVRTGRFNEAAAMLGDVEAEWLASTWRYEALPLADWCVQAGAHNLAGRLFHAAAEVLPGEIAGPVLGKGGLEMLRAEEYPAVLQLLEGADFPGRRGLVEKLLDTVVDKGLPIPAKHGAGLLTSQIEGDGQEVVSFLAGLAERALERNSPTASALLSGAGEFAPGVVAEMLSRAAAAGKLGTVVRLLALFPKGRLGRVEADHLLKTAEKLLAGARYAEVLDLYRRTGIPVLRNVALRAAVESVEKSPEEVLGFLLEVAGSAPVEQTMMDAAARAAQALAGNVASAPLLMKWLSSPLCLRDAAEAVLGRFIGVLWREDAPLLGRCIVSLVRETSVPEVLPRIPEHLYAAGDAGQPEKGRAVFDAVRDALGDGEGLSADVLLVLGDIYAVLDHPEVGVVIWDTLAFGPGKAEGIYGTAAAFRAGVYFVLSGKSERAEDYLSLARLSSVEGIARAAEAAQSEEGAARLITLLRGNKSAFPAAIRALDDFFAPLHRPKAAPAEPDGKEPADGGPEGQD